MPSRERRLQDLTSYFSTSQVNIKKLICIRSIISNFVRFIFIYFNYFTKEGIWKFCQINFFPLFYYFTKQEIWNLLNKRLSSTLDCCFLFSRQSFFFVETKMKQMNHRLTH
jgi:hypothetical protein